MGKLPCFEISGGVTAYGREMIDQTKKVRDKGKGRGESERERERSERARGREGEQGASKGRGERSVSVI